MRVRRTAVAGSSKCLGGYNERCLENGIGDIQQQGRV